MQLFLIGVLAVGCIALALWGYAANRTLGDLSRQLKARTETGSKARLDIAVPSARGEALASAINDMLEQEQVSGEANVAREQSLRQQISNVSHDLRTPLTSISGYLQLLEGDTLTDQERSAYLAIVSSRAKALQRLITSFYDLSRLEGGEYPLLREKIDLYSILSELIAQDYGLLTDSGLDVTVELGEGLPAVWGDGDAALRVFTNLLRNALEHGGRQLSIRLYGQGRTIVTAFSNDAAPLEQADLAHVFDRSFTLDKTRTHGNAGLGLAIVKTLVEQMGHRVEARQGEGQFTIFVHWNQ